MYLPRKWNLVTLAPLVIAALIVQGCTRRQETRTQTSATVRGGSPTTVDTTVEASVPAQGFDAYDPHLVEQGRSDTSWRSVARTEIMNERRRARALTADSTRIMNERRTAGAAGRDSGLAGAGINNPALAGLDRLSTGAPGDSVPVLTVQVWLDRVHFSPGVIDGRMGKNTAKALYWFQDAYGLNPTGDLDHATWQLLDRLTGHWDPLAAYTVTSRDLAGPFTPLPKSVYDKAKLQCLCYENAAEALGEQFHTTPEFLKTLNRGADLDNLAAGVTLHVPNVDQAGRAGALPDSVAQIVISKRGFYTHALDAEGRLLFHFPSTLGSQYDPSPDGQLKIVGIAWNPPFHYQPKLFHDVPDTDPEAQLPPGPNSPVGVVWMQLSQPNYGIHGTATPETIGYESSHGCVRLTNWDALFLAKHVKRGVPVSFTDGKVAALPAGGPNVAAANRKGR